MITFAGLWCYFDDYGRGEDDPELVKGTVWPRRRSHTPRRVAADLDAIAAEHLICRYQYAGIRLMHAPSWNEHQKISHRTPSRLPPCPVHEAALHSFFLDGHGDGLDRFRNGQITGEYTTPQNETEPSSGSKRPLYSRSARSGNAPETLRKRSGASSDQEEP